MIFRQILDRDLDGVLNIYSPFISRSFVTFETEVPTKVEFEQRVNNYTKHFPWLVAEEHGAIAGYAYASKYRERAAYQWMCEVSIYMHADYNGKGIAAKLYQALLEILKLQGIRKVYAVIAIPNPQSVGFHERLGFIWFATYKNVGNKFGKWRDVGWWEYDLLPAIENPAPPIPFSEIDAQVVENILSKYSGSN